MNDYVSVTNAEGETLRFPSQRQAVACAQSHADVTGKPVAVMDKRGRVKLELPRRTRVIIGGMEAVVTRTGKCHVEELGATFVTLAAAEQVIRSR